ncbi:hypothetical protein N7510_003638 [Penicillium lagena]|uniref:uncharacterized protein n=1 Tax=Penicillium lagena TaxID=94218 RepID=UPI0025403C2B|nr:uncharacterized protein N7510_003638 [Penicillium lagena]KAJ5619654.1 hypothetical protein N7510_003638 [Penicillium lagena]
MRPLCVSNHTLRVGQRPLLVSVLNGHRRAYNVAVLGGGITGLSAAWMLTHQPSCTSVTLYEKSPRLGGWMDSETIPVPGGKVVFEYGPRTLRGASPTSKPLLNMV